MNYLEYLVGLFAFVALLIGGTGTAIQAEKNPSVSRKQAIEIGNRQIGKMRIDLRDLDLEVDAGNKHWNEFMSILRDSPDSDAQRQFKQYERKLHGHSYWSIFYKPKREEGHGFKGGGATVLIDSTTGQVLLAIRGE